MEIDLVGGLTVTGLQEKLGLQFLQASVDSLDDVTFILLQNAFIDVSIHLLVHEVPQLGQVVILQEKNMSA